jgi:hypothetical protein
VPVSWALLVDLPRTLVGWDGPDRAGRLEPALDRRAAVGPIPLRDAVRPAAALRHREPPHRDRRRRCAENTGGQVILDVWARPEPLVAAGLPGLPGETCGMTHVAGAPTQRYVYIAPPKSPGIPAPLAWTLSDMAMDDLDDQRREELEPRQPGSAVRDFLQGGPCDG